MADTPTKYFIRNAIEELGPACINDIKMRTGLSDVMLYASIMQMEDAGEIIASCDMAQDRASAIYSLPGAH